MKDGDYVKIRKMSKRHKWYSPFGVLFYGLKGEIKGSIFDKEQRFIVSFKADRGTNMLCWFSESELKLLFQPPICENMKPLKNQQIAGIPVKNIIGGISP